MPRGYSTAGDILTRTRDGQDLNAIWDLYQAGLDQFNATRQPLIELLSFPVNNVIEDLVQPGEESMERATQFGVPVSVRPTPTVTARAYPFDWYDTRHGYTFQFLAGGPSQSAGASQRQLDQVLNTVMGADTKLQWELVMKALFNSANRTTRVDNLDYTVTALYNADGTYIPPYRGQTFTPGSHTHYVFSGQASQTAFDAQDHLDLARLVEEHGYTRANGFNVIFLMNPTDAQNGIMRFVRNTTIDLGAATDYAPLYDFIPAQGANMVVQLPPGFTLVGGLPPNTFAGLDVAGSWGPYLIVTDNQIPAGYMAAVAFAGQSAESNVIGIREHANPSLRGLVLRPGNNNAYPLIDSYFIRGLGTGVGPRGAAAIMQLHATAYSVPAAFAW